MLPGALFTTYRQYKEDTRQVVEWLAVTARTCGYKPPATEVVVTKAPKLKGRARKLARDAAASQAKQAQSDVASSKETIVKTREFFPMARTIADAVDSKVVIPLNILKTWRSCITARSTTAKWYEIEADSGRDHDDSNEKHVYFIDVLKESLQMLVPVAKLQELDKNNFRLPKSSTTPLEQVSNRYAHLEIQDIDEDTYDKLPNVVVEPTKSLQTNEPKGKFALDELEEMSEYLFMLDCFMADVQNVREQLKQVWENYADAQIDLTTASVTTSIGIEMIKRAEADFLKIKHSYGETFGDSPISMMWFGECCFRQGMKPPSQKPDRQFFVPMSAWKEAQESYLHIFRFLQVYSNGTMPGLEGPNRIFALTRPAYFGTYNPELEYDELPPTRQYEQVAALVNDMLVTVGGFVMLAESPNDDMLMSGIAYLQQNQISPPFWLCFAVQNFVDVHFILKTRSERPYEELRDFALSARRTLKDHQQFLEKHPLAKMRSQDDEEAVHETLREIEEWVLEDKVKQVMNSVKQVAATKKRRVWQDFEVLRMSPVLCGMLKYCYHIQLQWKGISLVNDTGIVTAAHMYNALQQNGYLTKNGEKIVWDDMEYLLDLHKAEDTFMGQRPRSIEDCTKRLALVQGVAPTTFARRRRGNNNRVLRSRAGSRFLSASTPVAQILGQKYLTRGESDWHLDQLDVIVGRKFDNDLKKIKEYDEEMNAEVDAIDVTTEQGKLEILDLFAPQSDRIYALLEEKDLSIIAFKKYFAELELERHAAPFHARWSKVLRKVLNDMPNTTIDGTPVEKEQYHEAKAGKRPAAVDESQIQSAEEVLLEVRDRWKKTKTLPIDLFVDIISDSLQIEYLDIQFDYFAFFRSAFSLMLELQKELSPLIEPRLLDQSQDKRVHELFALNEGAVCIVPQFSLLVACDPLDAPNIITLRPWLEVDLRPLQIAAKIMRSWIKENGDIYCTTEEERENKRTEDVLKEGPKVKYIDEDDSVLEKAPAERKIGWSSSIGLIESLNAREMREVFDAMKDDGPMGSTVAETMLRMGKLDSLSKEDQELVEMRSRMFKQEKEAKNKSDLESSEDDNNSLRGESAGPSNHWKKRHIFVDDDVD